MSLNKDRLVQKAGRRMVPCPGVPDECGTSKTKKNKPKNKS